MPINHLGVLNLLSIDSDSPGLEKENPGVTVFFYWKWNLVVLLSPILNSGSTHHLASTYLPVWALRNVPPHPLPQLRLCLFVCYLIQDFTLWPRPYTHNAPASASRELRLQACNTRSGAWSFKFCFPGRVSCNPGWFQNIFKLTTDLKAWWFSFQVLGLLE